ncbi:helix-turn-helix domain-containing protein [Saccharopolyspora sp. TS4A08]|uniref:Helix-turn-helix domain-containing protein n=1 Tax=Saccharopolyspora ipomoeae TaxID=3042027 RepID=A0ABT6PVZ7_9PSEU|nr:helix-turn-helix domain-containing protein [Saccharopolyspora sp. TS4A08]MDI2031571.1 helix-turn-helix domain-containing protein [Saccharopolyspora sp. TS4A08]
MQEDMYSVEQVAALLGLHVRTVRSYIRSGRLNAVRIGKQYRIAKSDLEQLTGRPTEPARTAGAVEVSSIVQLDGVDRAAADRLGSLVLAGMGAPRVQTIHDEHRNRLKIIIIGELAETSELLHLLDSVLDSESGLFTAE